MVGRCISDYDKAGTVGNVEARATKDCFEIDQHKHIRRGDDTSDHDLAAAIYFRLPRELRNHIYAYCIEPSYENEVIVRRSHKHKVAFEFLTRERYGPHAYRWVEDHIYSLVSTNALWENLGREMLEMYYWTRTFRFSHRELPFIASFLEMDHFGLGLAPAAYVRRLHLQIRHMTSTQHSDIRWRSAEQQTWVPNIANLGAMLTTRTEIIIDIEVAERYAEVERAIGIQGKASAMNLLTEVRALQAEGFRVQLRYSSSWSG